MNKKLLRKKQKGNVFLTALLLMIVLSLLGWAFISITITLATQSQKGFISKQAYFAADAGIERASMELWNGFQSVGQASDKMNQFVTFINDNLKDKAAPGYYLAGAELKTGGTTMYYNVALGPTASGTGPFNCNAYQTIVEVRSTGRVYLDDNQTQWVERNITALIKFYLKGTELTDFSYFTNNFGYMFGTKSGGSVCTNGVFLYKHDSGMDVQIAGGDRYKSCKNWKPKYKVDDGGIYASEIRDIGGAASDIQPFSDMVNNTTDPNSAPYHHVSGYSNFDHIEMPSLAGIEFYQKTAFASEADAESKGKKYGIYTWVPAGDAIYEADGTTLDHTSAGEYIKVSDGMYGDGITTYAGEPCYYQDGDGEWRQGEKTNLIVCNMDENYPTKIYGTVVVKGNIVINGQIRGAGAIFSGGSIYIPDGLKYDRSPTVNGVADVRGFTADNTDYGAEGCDADSKISTTGMLEDVRSNQQAWLEHNAPGSADDPNMKDLLGLYANENIVVGDVATKEDPNVVNSAGIIKDALARTEDLIIEGTSTSVKLNETDEACLGWDTVPHSRTGTTDVEHEAELNGYGGSNNYGNGKGWDVEFYTPSNPNPTGLINPSTKRPMTTIDPSDIPNSTQPYNSWSQDAQDAVIPGSGEDLDGDGGYDGPMDLYDSIAFDSSRAGTIRSNPSSQATWDSAFSFDPNTWGGNYDIKSGTVNYRTFYDNLASSNVFDPSQSWYTTYRSAFQVDGITYTNHVWGGICFGDINGGFLSRVEAIAYGPGGVTNHDDRLVGGGESVFESGIQVPQIEHMEFVGWKE